MASLHLPPVFKQGLSKLGDFVKGESSIHSKVAKGRHDINNGVNKTEKDVLHEAKTHADHNFAKLKEMSSKRIEHLELQETKLNSMAQKIDHQMKTANPEQMEVLKGIHKDLVEQRKLTTDLKRKEVKHHKELTQAEQNQNKLGEEIDNASPEAAAKTTKESTKLHKEIETDAKSFKNYIKENDKSIKTIDIDGKKVHIKDFKEIDTPENMKRIKDGRPPLDKKGRPYAMVKDKNSGDTLLLKEHDAKAFHKANGVSGLSSVVKTVFGVEAFETAKDLISALFTLGKEIVLGVILGAGYLLRKIWKKYKENKGIFQKSKDPNNQQATNTQATGTQATGTQATNTQATINNNPAISQVERELITEMAEIKATLRQIQYSHDLLSEFKNQTITEQQQLIDMLQKHKKTDPDSNNPTT